MKVSGMLTSDLEMTPQAVAELERLGYDASFTVEINSDPFLPLVLAAQHSSHIALSTCIAVAFARNPMTMAQLAWDINQYSRGRFTVGLGSQIKPHITRRFSMPWSKPAARMREYISAMRAIWHCWEHGGSLEFNGEFYRHDLMTPMFMATNKGFGAPRVNLAAVGPLMAEVAGEVADGVIAHGFTTARYLEEVTLPAVTRGLERAGRKRADFDVNAPVMVVTGATEEAFAQSRAAVRAQLGFYASTPAYRPVLDLHGWGDIQSEAHQLTRENRWEDLAALITDEMLATFAIVAQDTAEIPALLQQRYGHLVDTWQCTVLNSDADVQKALIAAVQAAPGADSSLSPQK